MLPAPERARHGPGETAPHAATLQRPPQDARPAVGQRGEALAGEHLVRLGYRIVERNARTPAGEIDLVVAGNGSVVFVEVKTRRCGCAAAADGAPAVDPLASLRPRQRLRLRRAAASWLGRRERPRPLAREIRFDAVGVVIDARGRLVRLDHVEAAW